MTGIAPAVQRDVMRLRDATTVHHQRPAHLRRGLLVIAALTFGACTGLTLPDNAAGRVATVEWEGTTPMLFMQNADGGDRVRVHFDSVTDDIPGNRQDLPVSDTTLLAINRIRWSPNGLYLAVVVAPAYEALQVVLVSAEGRALRTVSNNSQYIWSDVEWSPDSRRIAYVMATGQNGTYPDLFITDLDDDHITRVTTSNIPYGSSYDTFRFDRSGGRLYFAKHLGWAPDSVNPLSRLGRVDLGTGAIVEGKEVVGEPQGLSRDGTWGLFIRRSATQPGQPQLVREPFLFQKAPEVLASGNLAHAIILEGDGKALVASENPSQTAKVFRVLGLAAHNDVRATLTTLPSTTWAALWRAIR